jgi:hypothetical protein
MAHISAQDDFHKIRAACEGIFRFGGKWHERCVVPAWKQRDVMTAINRSEKATRTLAQLSEEHARMERWFVEIIERAATGDPRECDAVWADFARQMESHMAFEESEVFPLYEQRGPAAAAAAQELRQEHTAIRKTIDQLGMDLQLHLARAAVIESFLTSLRSHARLERETIYLG